MKRLLLRWIILVVALIVSAKLTSLIPWTGFDVDTSLNGIPRLFLGVAVLAAVNLTFGKLLKLLTLPLNCLTLGLFSLVINAAMLMLVGQLGLGFTVKGFLSAFIGSILLSIVNALLESFLVPDEKKEAD